MTALLLLAAVTLAGPTTYTAQRAGLREPARPQAPARPAQAEAPAVAPAVQRTRYVPCAPPVWNGRWLPIATQVPTVTEVVEKVALPAPVKTAWQLGPTRVENPGKAIAFHALPSAFTALQPFVLDQAE